MQEMYISKLSEYLNAIERLKTYYPNQIIVHNPTSLSVNFQKKKQIECKEILELLKTTPRSFDEIKAFLKGEESEEE